MGKRFFSNVFVSLIGGVVGGAAVWYAMSTGVLPQVGTVTSTSGTTTVTAERQVEETSATTEVVTAASDSVVSIVVTKEYERVQRGGGNFGGSFFQPFFDDQGQAESVVEEVEIASGTGFVVTEDGLIVTNRHVVSESGSTYTIVFPNGDTYEAEVLDRDLTTDLALLQIEAEGLTPLALADSDEIVVGQSVIAIGNTLGEYSNTVTKGVISGLSRDLGGQYSGLIQTDAAINSGNSGGPLLNLDGEVIGINTAVDRSGEGIGFAIPINDAKSAIESVKEHGRIIRAGLGVRYIEITAEIAELNDLPYDYGAYIRGDARQFGVVVGGAADKAGINEGDIILEVDGTKVDDENPLSQLLKGKQVGEQVTLKVYQNAEENEVTVTLEELPGDKQTQNEKKIEEQKAGE